jgi:hypothetical protein
MFSVVFRGEHGNMHVVSIERPPAGLRALDGARAQLGPQVTHIEEPLGYYKYELACSVSETQARRACSASGAFGYDFGVSVVVPRAALNTYVLVRWRPLSTSETIAACDYGIDARQLVEDWINDGAPLEWTPDGYEPDNDNQ